MYQNYTDVKLGKKLGGRLKLKSPRKMLCIFFALFFLVFAFQNCGRIEVTEKQIEESVSLEVPSVLDVSLNKQFIIEYERNTPVDFQIPLEEESAGLARVSLDEEQTLLSSLTQLNAVIEIAQNSFLITYTPANGILGEDFSKLYLKSLSGELVEIELIFRPLNNQEELPTKKALIYGPSSEERVYFQQKLLGYEAPELGEIFNKWPRFAGTKYFLNIDEVDRNNPLAYCMSEKDSNTGRFTSTTDPEGNPVPDPGSNNVCNASEDFLAMAWSLVGDPSRVICVANSGRVTGFLSPLDFEYYTHEAVLTSTNRDDDRIGIVIAARTDAGGKLHVLEATRTQGGTQPGLGWGILYYVDGVTKKIIDEKSVGGIFKNSGPAGSNDGWSGKRTLVRVVRDANIIKASTSEWFMAGEIPSISEESLIEIDLNDESLGLEFFKGPGAYGYSSFSQYFSEFTDIKFSTGNSGTYLYDLSTSSVYERQLEGDFKERTDIDLYTHLGTPRVITNPDTGKKFFLRSDRTYEEVD